MNTTTLSLDLSYNNPVSLEPQVMRRDFNSTNFWESPELDDNIADLTYSKRLHERFHDVSRKRTIRKRYARHHRRHQRSSPLDIPTPSIIRKSILTRIAKLAPEQKLMPLSCVSAAAILGAPLPEKDLYCSLYMGTNIKKNPQRTSLCLAHDSPALSHHYIDYNLSDEIREKLLISHNENSSQCSQHREELYMPQYSAIDGTIGFCSGILVTSPLQTMFDCMRILPFHYGLTICDYLSALYDISSTGIDEFVSAHKSLKHAQMAAYRLQFVDKNSTSYYESLCRALMIKAGVCIPLVHSRLSQTLSASSSSPYTVSPDFMWELPSYMNRAVNTPSRYIVAHIDGYKYFHFQSTREEMSTSDAPSISYRQLEELLAVSNCTIIRLSTREISVDHSQRLIEKLRDSYVPFVCSEEMATRTKYLHNRNRLRL